MNPCNFSPCRRYRYTLEHVIDPLPITKPRRLAAIMLNPSVANEEQLDPTLRRVRGFAVREGCNVFEIGNAFAWRDTLPENMLLAVDPVGPLNDEYLLAIAGRADVIVVGWGTYGSHRGRDMQVAKLLSGFTLLCLGKNGDGSPKHPLYVKGAAPLIPWP